MQSLSTSGWPLSPNGVAAMEPPAANTIPGVFHSSSTSLNTPLTSSLENARSPATHAS